MTCDSLLSADVVTAAGELVTASEADHRDLFWALRGGGGNFGIVTEFEFRLHPTGPIVAFVAPVYPIDMAPDVVGAFRDFMRTAPDEINAAATFWTLPAALPFPPPFHGRDVVILNAIYISWARNDPSNIFRLNQNITWHPADIHQQKWNRRAKAVPQISLSRPSCSIFVQQARDQRLIRQPLGERPLQAPPNTQANHPIW